MNFTKLISLFTSLCFLFSVLTQNIYAFNNNESNVIDKYANEFSFLDKFGKITEKSDIRNDLKVINIQDLHSNYSAQINIKKYFELNRFKL